MGASALRRSVGGRVVAPRARRPRRVALGVADLRGGVLPGRLAPSGSPERHLPARADRYEFGTPSSRRASAAHGRGRRPVVPGLVRAQRRQRSGRVSTLPENVDGGWTLNGRRHGRPAARSAPTCSDCSAPTPRASGTRVDLPLVPLDPPGVTVRGFGRLDGDEGFAEVFFDDAFLPDDAVRWVVLGEVDGGWSVAMATMVRSAALRCVRRRIIKLGVIAAHKSVFRSEL